MKIYKIVSEHSTKCYVGKTTKTLPRRFGNHRSAYNRWWEMKDKWCSAIGLLMLGDCSIELIEETEDEQREVYWIQELDCVNNVSFRFGGKSDPVKKRRYMVAYYERFKAHKGERVACDHCGTEVRRAGMRRHQQTKKCQTIYAAKCEK